MAALFMGSISIHRDDLDAARRYYALAEADVAAGHAAPYEAFLLPWLQAMVADVKGDTSKALSLFQRYWAPLSALGLLSLLRFGALEYTRALVAAGRTGDAHAVADLMDDLAQRSGGVATASAKALHCQGLAAGDADLVLQAAELHRAGPRPVELAEAAWTPGVRSVRTGARRTVPRSSGRRLSASRRWVLVVTCGRSRQGCEMSA